MGGCLSLCGQDEAKYVKQELSSAPQAPVSKKDKAAHREQGWRATGIIGLRDQGLNQLPSSIASVGEAARVLDATSNQLVEVPLFVGQLINLQRLVLANNRIKVLPGPVMACLTSLKLLDVSGNSLSELPEELCQLQKLEKLQVNRNSLRQLPDAISGMVKLQFLCVADNLLTSLPALLPAELEEVDASRNAIEVIPATLSTLVKVKVINLDSNRVRDVPAEVLEQCSALHTLSLHNNPITPDTLADNPGFTAFERRRQGKYNKAIAGGVLLGTAGLDEGVDRKVAPRSP